VAKRALRYSGINPKNVYWEDLEWNLLVDSEEQVGIIDLMPAVSCRESFHHLFK